MKFFTKEVQIACVAIFGVVVLFFGLHFLKGLSLFSTDNSYYVTFDDISGLSASSPIYANGYKVGTVKDIVYNYDGKGKIVAKIGLDKNMHLPKGSTAEIESDFMGNVKMNLVLSDNPIENVLSGDTISGRQETGLMAKAGNMLPAVESMLPKLDSILTSLNALMADPALAASLHNVNTITDNLVTTTKQLNSLTTSLNRNVPGMMAKADKVLGNAEKLTDNLNELDIACTMTKVNNTLDNVEQMTAKLNSKDGTLGLLMHDPQLYYNLTATMRDADSLMTDLKAHPKRYVHFSIFGKKDK